MAIAACGPRRGRARRRRNRTLPVERGQPVCAIVSVGSAIAAGAVGSGGETAQPVVAVVDEIRIAGQRGDVAEVVVGVAVVETLARARAQPHPEALQLAAVARLHEMRGKSHCL